MIFPEKMCKIVIMGMKGKLKEVRDFLYSSKLVHLEKVEIGKSPCPDKNEIKYLELKEKMDSLFSKLSGFVEIKRGKEYKMLNDKDILKGEELIEEFADMLKEVESITDEEEELVKQYEVLKLLYGFNLKQIHLIPKIKKHEIIIGRIVKGKYPTFISRVEELKKEKIVDFYANKKEDYYEVMIIFLREDKVSFGDILDLFDKYYYLREVYDKFKSWNKNIDDVIKNVKKRIDILKERYSQVIKAINKKYEDNKEYLNDLKYSLDNKVALLKGIEMFGEGEYVYCIEGYVPCNKTRYIKRKIHDVDKSAVIYVKEEEKDAPIMLKYPKILSGIHLLLESYSLPAYRYLDPSIFMIFTFPIFYGFILGDIGYGILLLILSICTISLSKSRSIKLLSQVLFISAISSIFFGFIFGEFFGKEVILGYHLHPLLHRMEDILTLMKISILIGVLHINLGYFLGITQSLLHKKYLDALTHYFSWIILEVSVIFFALSVIETSRFLYVGLGLCILSIFMIYCGEKLKGVFELPSIFTHVLSYIRLGAVGLSSVAIAYVVNIFVDMFFSKGVWWAYLGGVVIFAIGHTFNLILGIIGPFLHSLRLHYVEFFTKFYKSGGRKYKPYGKLEEYD